MQRSPELYLAELERWTSYLLERTKGKKLQDYLEDLDFRLASERAFILIGEAMALLKRHYPEISLELDDRSAAIGFRNFLVHQYWNIDNRDVWTTLTANVGPLHDAVLAMLKKLDAAE